MTAQHGQIMQLGLCGISAIMGKLGQKINVMDYQLKLIGMGFVAQMAMD
jgi:hypothetical protein